MNFDTEMTESQMYDMLDEVEVEDTDQQVETFVS